MSNGQSVNFADGESNPLHSSTLNYLGQRLDDTACLLQARENFAILYKDMQAPEVYQALRCNFGHWRRVFVYEPEVQVHAPAAVSADATATEAEEAPVNPDAFLPSLGVWVARGRDESGHLWELAAKAGHNNEHHNHNDIGSFILNIDGTPLIMEIGAPQYVKDFFCDETRYGFLASRSLGHSVPLIRGYEQSPGQEFAGTILRADIDQNTVVFEADITQAYAADAGCRRLVRRLTLNKAGGELLLEDEIELDPAPEEVAAEAGAEDGKTESALICSGDAEVVLESPTVATVSRNGVILRLALEGGAVWDRVDQPEYRTHGGVDTYVHRLAAIFPDATPDLDAERFQFRTRITLATQTAITAAVADAPAIAEPEAATAAH